MAIPLKEYQALANNGGARLQKGWNTSTGPLWGLAALEFPHVREYLLKMEEHPIKYLGVAAGTKDLELIFKLRSFSGFDAQIALGKAIEQTLYLSKNSALVFEEQIHLYIAADDLSRFFKGEDLAFAEYCRENIYEYITS